MFNFAQMLAGRAATGGPSGPDAAVVAFLDLLEERDLISDATYTRAYGWPTSMQGISASGVVQVTGAGQLCPWKAEWNGSKWVRPSGAITESHHGIDMPMDSAGAMWAPGVDQPVFPSQDFSTDWLGTLTVGTDTAADGTTANIKLTDTSNGATQTISRTFARGSYQTIMRGSVRVKKDPTRPVGAIIIADDDGTTPRSMTIWVDPSDGTASFSHNCLSYYSLATRSLSDDYFLVMWGYNSESDSTSITVSLAAAYTTAKGAANDGTVVGGNTFDDITIGMATGFSYAPLWGLGVRSTSSGVTQSAASYRAPVTLTKESGTFILAMRPLLFLDATNYLTTAPNAILARQTSNASAGVQVTSPGIGSKGLRVTVGGATADAAALPSFVSHEDLLLVFVSWSGGTARGGFINKTTGEYSYTADFAYTEASVYDIAKVDTGGLYGGAASGMWLEVRNDALTAAEIIGEFAP